MKTISVKLVMGLCLLSPIIARAQFNSGSTGADGPLNVTADTTLNLPPNGIFNFTTITVASGATLKFNRNALNTPVYFLATSDVNINGQIDVSGKSPTFGKGGEGGPGGFDGGAPAPIPTEPAGDGLGPGGGKGVNASVSGAIAGSGAYGSNPPRFRGGTDYQGRDGVAYGNTLLQPLIAGSGGGGERGSLGGGGGGGGAILIASNTRISLGGSIKAWGASGAPAGGTSVGNGSGGGVRLIAPEVRGSGVIDARGLSGGNGRVRVDAVTRFDLNIQIFLASYTIGKFMQVFPTSNSRLDILEAAGTTIPEGNAGAVSVTLPLGSPTSQSVKIQARDFTGIVPITVAVTPNTGSATRYDTQIDMAGGALASTTVTVTIPVGTTCQIHAWTR